MEPRCGGFVVAIAIPSSSEPFDCGDFGAIGLHRQHRAVFHGFALEQDGTCAADGSFTTDVRAGEAEYVAKIVDQKQARLDLAFIGFSIDSKLNFGGHMRSVRCLSRTCWAAAGGDEAGERGRDVSAARKKIQGTARTQHRRRCYTSGGAQGAASPREGPSPPERNSKSRFTRTSLFARH